MNTKIELEGQSFERLIVIKEDPIRTKNGVVKWFCKCECGNKVSVAGSSLLRGNTKSCGCLRREGLTTHGLSKHPLYRVYWDMKSRCNNTKDTGYGYYGGRGIKVCSRWLNSFENFYKDVKVDYKEGLELDRIDNDKGYSKENCRWVTHQQNSMNIRPRKNSSSQYKGVVQNKRDSKYVSQVTKDGEVFYLGTFTDEKEAAIAYNEAALKLFGAYSNLNKIED